MEELLASQTKKPLNLFRGQEVEGEIVVKGDKELILDLGTKSEGILSLRDLSADQLENLKKGDKLKAYVILPENESGQVVLSLKPYSASKPQKGSRINRRGLFSYENWAKFIQAQKQQTKLNGKVVEINKGGLIIDIDGIRGFLPNSQVGFELLIKSGKGLEELIGQSLTVTVIEIDEANNRLIFSQRGQVSNEVLEKLKGFKNGQKATGQLVAILPFGLVVDLSGVEGLVFISDVAWEKVEDLSSLYKVGQEVEVMVLGADDQLGRINLSIKHLTSDPFTKLAEKYPADEVVKGEIVEVSASGVAVKLEDPSGELGTSGVEGFLPATKMDPDSKYELGEFMSFLVDSVDMQRRRVNLAPLITTTEGLIYK